MYDAAHSGWTTTSGAASECNWLVKVGGPSPVPYDYEIRFNAQGDTAFFPPTMRLPFQIWNSTLNTQVDVGNFTPSTTDSTPEMKAAWTSGDILKSREKIEGKIKFTWEITCTKSDLY